MLEDGLSHNFINMTAAYKKKDFYFGKGCKNI